MKLKQRALKGDEDALEELLRQRVDEQRKRADEQRKRADEQHKRADELQKRADDLQARVKQLRYAFTVSNRCTLEYLRMRPI